MALRFTVLASGSAGNASLLEADGFSVLIDAGLGPRQLAQRLAAVGASWEQVQAVLLTHTHSDHWKERTLAHLRRRRIPLYCHAQHHPTLLAYSMAFPQLLKDQLVHGYEPGGELTLGASLRCRPLPVRHDGGATFGFRFEGSADLFGQPWALAYVADLGSWTPELAQAMADVDLLALEFNHDVELEHASGRSAHLIARVLGDAGHLSNSQAAGLLQEVVRLSEPGRLQHVVQLHLSRDCNRPELAVEAIRDLLADGVAIHTASQDEAGPALMLGMLAAKTRTTRGPRNPSSSRRADPSASQAWLPGW
ncbi:MAG: MBL fold metallo-hydrolase [Planctomycetes bacterium]|nr:MBL fold metallo-hydrolase [Planctomycetota bacterium]